MATRLEDEFDPTRINAPDAAYPAGSLKDETTPGVSDDGTPLASRVGNDWQGFSQSVLDKAGIAANGQPDSVTNPQILQAIEQMYNDGDSQLAGGNIWPLSSQDSLPLGVQTSNVPINISRLKVDTGNGDSGVELLYLWVADGDFSSLAHVVSDISENTSNGYTVTTDQGVYTFVTEEIFNLRNNGSSLGWIQDSSLTSVHTQLLEWSAYVATDRDSAILEGNITLDTGVILDFQNIPTVINFNAKFQAIGPVSGFLVEFRNIAFSSMSGLCEIFGTGTAVWSTRTVDNLLFLNGLPRSASDVLWRLRYSKYQGSRCSGLSGFNTNGLSIGRVVANDCGPTVGDATEAYTNAVNNGSPNSPSQFTTLNVANLLDYTFEDGDVAVIDGYPYLIVGSSGTSLNVFPWVEKNTINPGDDSGNLDLIIGSALKITGPDAGIIGVESLYVTNCSRSYQGDSLYGAIINRCVLQFNTIGAQVSSNQSSIKITNSFRGYYVEGNEFDFVGVNTSGGVFIEAEYALNYEKVLNLSSRAADGTLNPLSEGLIGTEISDVNARRRFIQQPRNAGSLTSFQRTLGERDSIPYLRTGGSPNLTVTYDDDQNRLFGYSDITLNFKRFGSNTPPTLTITLDPVDVSDGWTLEGGATSSSYVQTSPAFQLVLFADVDTKTWDPRFINMDIISPT